jgi:hypothetical protein
MMERGWGQQMKCVHVQAPASLWEEKQGYGLRTEDRDRGVRSWRLVEYLIKYLSKDCGLRDSAEKKKRLFGGSASAKAGTVKFRWLPEVEPSAYLYYYGREIFRAMNDGISPTWRDTSEVIRLGVENTDWLSVDPWWSPYSPSG